VTLIRHQCNDFPILSHDFYLASTDPWFETIGTFKLELEGGSFTINLDEEEVDMFDPQEALEDYIHDMKIPKTRVRLEELDVFTDQSYIDMTRILDFPGCSGLQNIGYGRYAGSVTYQFAITYIEGATRRTLAKANVVDGDDVTTRYVLKFDEQWQEGAWFV
jgi:hypothetical protein